MIKINGGKDVATSSIEASGSESFIINDEAITHFGLDVASLKKAVGKEMGKDPSDAYLKSPTPWGDLYKKDHLDQVTVVREVASARIIDLDMRPSMISSTIFENNSAHVAKVNCKITDSVTNTVESNWSKTNTLGVTQTVKYNISFLGAGGGGSTAFSYSHEWSKGGSESQSTTVGSESGAEVELDPGEKVKAILTASKGKLRIEVIYRTYLTGIVVANYSKKFNEHHFYYPHIQNVMRAANLEYEYFTTEVIEVGYYAESHVNVVDPDEKPKAFREVELTW
ncbi:hypothetical protein [Brevundimonas sp.]|uniref:hypothetical protein n=1 Tax=Brevundimonas sp. TaxID=1871086 RepID=UPI002E11703D|nr:hypothetical protein [Brevundimonas sp.]